MGINLDTITTFGEIDADADPLLEQAFEDHDVYIKVRSHEKYVVLGRKGAGKTAIYRKIVGLKQDDVFSIGHTFSDYPWHHHAKQKEAGVPEEFCYRQSWEYLINITLAKVLLSRDGSQPWSDQALLEMAALETFVIDTYGSVTPDLRTIFSPAKKLKLKGELAASWAIVNAKIAAEAVPIEYLPLIVQEVNKNFLGSILKCLNPDFDYFVCFDELDLGFSLDATDYKNRLIGLLLAARRINNMARDEERRLSVVIFLRDDIYEMLHFEDKNKITDMASAQIEWDIGRTGPSLKALMERRFHVILDIPQSGAWDQVFDETQRMTGKQPKYDHILDRTFYRPRDIIRFCNDILTAHRSSSNLPSRSFSNKDIIEARHSYSEYLLRELDDEIAKHYPRYGLYLEILKNIGTLTFALADMERVVQERADIIDEEDLKATEILRRLFDFSVIGFYRPGGGGLGGSEYVWKHRERRARFNESASFYRIHPGFMEVLGVKKFTRTQ